MSLAELEAEIMRLEPRDQAYLFEKLALALDGEDRSTVDGGGTGSAR